MQITIVQAEIEKAIEAYVLSQLAVRAGQKVTIELRATRGDTGMQAIIDISPAQQAVQPVQAQGSIRTAAVSQKQAEKPVVTMTDLKRMQAEEEAAEAAATDASEEAGGIQEESPETPVEADQETGGGVDPAEETQVEEEPVQTAPPPRTNPVPVRAPGNPLVKPGSSSGPAKGAAQVAGAPNAPAQPQKRLFAGFSRPSNTSAE